jgi:surfeit locus 1 family protein
VTRSLFRSLLVPGVMTAVMLATLVTLGTWQVNRLVWKRDLLAAIAAAEVQPPVPLGTTPSPFALVRAEGRFETVSALYGADVRSVAGTPTGGARLLGVLRREGAAPVLVDRGWIPVSQPATAPSPLPGGPAVVDGYVRPPDTAGLFAPADDLANRRFYTLDPAAIGRALGVADLAPFILVELGAAAGPGAPEPARSLPRPPNNHLVYAITWYGLAVALMVVFAVHVRKVLRHDRPG